MDGITGTQLVHTQSDLAQPYVDAEPDYCRICRAEAVDGEPLFHPCKCIGSIKYVHQDCLMEWLSHTQKKHCELCKTPFRFTKLYSPDMPQSLPYKILLRHFVIHTAKNLATWLRACLVATVWLGCLPFMIITVWRLLFWFSDGGWPSTHWMLDSPHNLSTFQALELARKFHFAALSGNGTSPVTPLVPTNTTPITTYNLISKFIGLIMKSFNLNKDTIAASLIGGLYDSAGMPNASYLDMDVRIVNATNTTQLFLRELSAPVLPPTLLSNVAFLKNLTRSPFINQLVLTVTEGQLITLIVVLTLILVFLIREWVVQQQPGINMGAGFDADFANPDRIGQQPAPEAALDFLQQVPVDVGNAGGDRLGLRDAGHRPIARARVRNRHNEDAIRQQALDIPRAPPPAENDLNLDASPNLLDVRRNRPPSIRDAMSPAAEIQRKLTEDPQPRNTEEFLSIWRRADSDPEEALRIIELEDRGDDLRYWVNAMKSFKDYPLPQGISRDHHEHGDPSPSIGLHTGDLFPDVGDGDKSNASSESWFDVVKSTGAGTRNSLESENTKALSDDEEEVNPAINEKRKGKGKETDSTERSPFLDREIPSPTSPSWESSTASDPFQFSTDTPRQVSTLQSSPPLRAVSYGQRRTDPISVLGNNPWSFPELLEAEDEPTASRATPCNHAESPTEEPTEVSSLPNEENSDRQEANSMPPLADLTQIASSSNISTISTSIEASHRDSTIHTAQDDDTNEMATTQDSPHGPQINNEHLPQDVPPNIAQPVEPLGFFGRLEMWAELVANWLWGLDGELVGGNRGDEGRNEEHIVNDLAAEAPFVPVARLDPPDDNEDELQERDREAVEAAIAAGLDPDDPDVIDDGEDFEDIMGLVGMRGPIIGLIQNALFSGFLLNAVISIGIWIPYNIGRVVLLLIANPGSTCKLPLRLLFGGAAFLQDLGLAILGALSYFMVFTCMLPWTLWEFYSVDESLPPGTSTLAAEALKICNSAVERIMDGVVDTFLHFADSEIFAFSAASHEALITIRSTISGTLTKIISSIIFVTKGNYFNTTTNIFSWPTSFFRASIGSPSNLLRYLARPDNWVIHLDVVRRSVPLDLSLSYWGDLDRFWAILAGYATLCTLGILYVKKGTTFSTNQPGREWEATLIDLLNQAGGVMKVIFIISIEMLVFPLYCGLLLDAALLPIFEDATIRSRILFTMASPFTSIFVHWFVGTCYMFHFALFVSMCRKIMRDGVLYFIRDPDDPKFHPVRDVLERNITTQLRKILFSALVYGALVVICAGGVVWGISFAFHGVLPIHWSSNEPVMEFPIDLLFYNFLMPLAVKVFKPSDGLHAMYSWWFQTCAGMLRLTWFMFDNRVLDEEGHHVRRTWKDLIFGAKGDASEPFDPTSSQDETTPFTNNPELRAYFQRDGTYVRAPASDQVRIPKGEDVFLQVDETNSRIDGMWDHPDGLHGRDSELFQQVYIPPWFRTRVCLFVFSIWIFAATSGICITVIPLIFGRMVFISIIPSCAQKNDVYAFSIGIYILGSVLYLLLHIRIGFNYIYGYLTAHAAAPIAAVRRLAAMGAQALRIVWTYVAFVLVLPSLLAMVMELYFIVPLHTYYSPGEQHVIHFVQSWTLGLLYLNLTSRLVLLFDNSRPAQALRAIMRNGYFDPDARLATRSFILPVSCVLLIALLVPYSLASMFANLFLIDQAASQAILFRYAYPLNACLFAIFYANFVLLGILTGWKQKIKDEVYLIGERLHNFGDKKGMVEIPSHSIKMET